MPDSDPGEATNAYSDDDFEDIDEEEGLDQEVASQPSIPSAVGESASAGQPVGRPPSGPLGGSGRLASRLGGGGGGSRPSSRASVALNLDGGAADSGYQPRGLAGGASPPTPSGLRRRPDSQAQSGMVSLDNGLTDLPRTGSAGSTASRRVVRGVVSVEDKSGSKGRPGAGDSVPKAAASSVPLWLQSDVTFERPTSRAGQGRRSGDLDASPPVDGGRGSSSSRLKPPQDPFGDLGLGARLGSGAGSRRGVPSASPDGLGTPSATPRVGTATDGDDRKVKRQQQEIQRLTQRLKEADMFSSQDDGLPKFVLDEVEIGYQIGQGGFSSVHSATWNCTPCALKKIFDPVITEELKGEFENEVRMLRILRHPNIITLMGVCRVPPALSILTEFVEGGSLFDLLHCPSKERAADLPDAEPGALWPLVQQGAAALAYLHKMCVVHRDVKSQNLLLTAAARPTAKLCDFGLARMKSELGTGTMQFAGTAPYMAPELFAKRKYTEAVDTWAYGTMIWEVASMEIPHANLDPADIAHRAQHKEAAALAIAPNWPKSLKALIRDTLQVQPESRPAMLDLTRALGQVVKDWPAKDGF